MTPAEVRTLARDLMVQHGLEDWNLKLGTAKRVYGTCYHRTQTIKISTALAAINPVSETHNTILHEIAHALADPDMAMTRTGRVLPVPSVLTLSVAMTLRHRNPRGLLSAPPLTVITR